MNKAQKAALAEKFAVEVLHLQPVEMQSTGWKCSSCGKFWAYSVPVKPPAPCECGGIAFEQIRVRH